MRQRVNNRRPGYEDITIDPSWDNFKIFLADMGERPDGMTLGRVDNNGNYCKENCRWETAIQQAQNRRNTSPYGPYIFMEGRSFRVEIKRLGVLKFCKTRDEAETVRALALDAAGELGTRTETLPSE